MNIGKYLKKYREKANTLFVKKPTRLGKSADCAQDGYYLASTFT